MLSKRFIIVGPGGSGKDHLAKLLKLKGYRKAVSCTTRPQRTGEQDGQDYFFITEEEFKDMVREDRFKEWYTFGADNWMYGTLMVVYQEASLFIMSPAGLRAVAADRHLFTVIYLNIPEDIRRGRLEARADADSVERRILADREDFRDFSDYDIEVTDPAFTAEAILP